MEVDITRFFKNAGMRDYSASAAELGANAGRITWANACKDVPEWNLLDTAEKLEALREHAKGFGAWSDEEISAWTQVEVNALFIQLIAGDIRESGIDTQCPDWARYEKDNDGGRNFYAGDDEQVYYYLGN